MYQQYVAVMVLALSIVLGVLYQEYNTSRQIADAIKQEIYKTN